MITCMQDLKDTLIYTRISGYGQTGPKAHLAGYASVCEAYGGIRHLNGYLDRPPVRPNISLGDSLTGLHAAFGAVMALLHRQRHHLKTPGQVRHIAGPFPHCDMLCMGANGCALHFLTKAHGLHICLRACNMPLIRHARWFGSRLHSLRHAKQPAHAVVPCAGGRCGHQ